MDSVLKISGFFSNLFAAYRGESTCINAELVKIRNEVYDISMIPTTQSDRKNLRSDTRNFLKDTQKVQSALKENLLNGKTE